MLLKKVVKFIERHQSRNLFFTFIKKVTQAQMFSSKFCEIFENNHFAEKLVASVSGTTLIKNGLEKLVYVNILQMRK